MTNTDTLIHRGLALAALFQASDLVNRLASQGQIPESSFSIMRNSLFRFEVQRLEDIYLSDENIGDIHSGVINLPETLRQNLHPGLRVCQQVFDTGRSDEYTHCIRYCMALIQLEKHFRSDTNMQLRVREELKRIKDTIQNENEINQALSDLYVESLAKLPFRIQVLGKMQYLQNNTNEHRVRVLLFAGLRAAMLWQQNGGRRWHFLFAKNSIKKSLSLIKNS